MPATIAKRDSVSGRVVTAHLVRSDMERTTQWPSMFASMAAIVGGCYTLAPIPDPALGPRKIDVATMYNTDRYRRNLGNDALGRTGWGGSLRIDSDVLVCSDHKEATETTLEIVNKIPDLRGLDSGELSNAAPIEAFAAVLLQVNVRYRTRVALRFTGIPE